MMNYDEWYLDTDSSTESVNFPCQLWTYLIMTSNKAFRDSLIGETIRKRKGCLEVTVKNKTQEPLYITFTQNSELFMNFKRFSLSHEPHTLSLNSSNRISNKIIPIHREIFNISTYDVNNLTIPLFYIHFHGFFEN